jgi:glycolate oxidase iron-sulfur subunit
MQTRFAAEQLADPALRTADENLRRCVHCGFCNATCPTFLLQGDELEGPRGRIYLIKDLLESGRAPGAEVVRHIDSCLTCLSCMSTCPSGVNYMHLVDIARGRITAAFRRPFGELLLRRMLGWILASRRLAALGIAAGRVAAALHLPLPGALRPALELLRKVPSRRAPALQRFYPASGTARGRVALLAGCVQQALDNEINHATARLLNRLQFDVEVLPDACCGAIHQHLGFRETALRQVRRNLRHWMQRHERTPFAAIVANASGCGTQLKDYRFLLREDPGLRDRAAEFSALVRDAGELLADLEVPGPLRESHLGMPVACQVPCSLRHGQKLAGCYPELLRRYGFTVAVPAEDHLCCGSAGTYNLLEAETAEELGRRKAEHVAATGAALLASGNLGCMAQLAPRVSMPVVHVVQLLDWVSGGPRPPGI